MTQYLKNQPNKFRVVNLIMKSEKLVELVNGVVES